jgi:pantothenate kinase
MIDLKQICLNLDKELSKEETKEDILLSCASEKLSALYVVQSENMDAVLNELQRSIDVNDIEYTYKVIKKLARSLNTNRKQLIRIIEEMNNSGKV